MKKMSRAELDTAESKDSALGKGPKRPRDAATLLLLDRTSPDEISVLMGRRHMSHAFMPGKFVFPGGRTDPTDSRVKTSDELHPLVEHRLCTNRTSKARARAIALSAIRETYEECGALIGRRADYQSGISGWQGFCNHGVAPTLSQLRLVARAITPPGRVRRYDTRFFAVWREDAVALTLPDGGPTNELEEQVWMPLDEARTLDIPRITSWILGDLIERLKDDPQLSPDSNIPFYQMRYNQFLRTMV
ncbi:NUDIX hydrolase [Limoniibacter endophyticus]|uniref:NUDIX hydrolase n=1 Tax=Limoniibacter endophyticus TaxID=1565040 RepID=A0A8J3GFE9_9HYPH|nr:NUDIX hydrolase [Limoniibacter endophyticus]GHC62342.1 NUDIX hydrolase [Limoniibacter endophyticus]